MSAFHRNSSQLSALGGPGGGPGRRSLFATMLAVGTFLSFLALGPMAAQAQVRHEAPLAVTGTAPGSAVATFCAHLPASTVSSTVGYEVKLLEAKVENGSDECVYFGAVEVIIAQHPNVPAGELSTLAKAEAHLKAESPKSVKITFTALPSLGPTAFIWTYTLNGGKLVGIGDNKGSTSWGSLISGRPSLVTGASHITALEHLIKDDMKA